MPQLRQVGDEYSIMLLCRIVRFKFNGQTYSAKTNAKGIAQATVQKAMIQKLQKGKTYSVAITYLKDKIKTTVKVK